MMNDNNIRIETAASSYWMYTDMASRPTRMATAFRGKVVMANGFGFTDEEAIAACKKDLETSEGIKL